jgi:trehalose 6-phosphate synthase
MKSLDGKTLIVSNRLPVRISRNKERISIEPGSGGLITALAPVLKDRGGTWVGWDGDPLGEAPGGLLEDHSATVGYQLKPLSLSADEVEEYYHGFSNETLWPLFHDLLGHCRFSRQNWITYRNVNQKFARATAAHAQSEDLIWVHDYQLLLVARYLEELGVTARKAFFLHIPFPSWDLFMRLPWRTEIIHSLLAYDLLGFQTERDRRNFTQCVRNCFLGSRIKGSPRDQAIEHEGREIRLGAFPISIDYEAFNHLAASEEVAKKAWLIHETLPNRKLVLGVDRLDYTKGIPERLEAFEVLLEKYPQVRGRITLVQIAVPSRTHVPEYQIMKENIDQNVGRINGQYTRNGWIPIHYIYRNLPRPELVSYYRTSEIALITPLKDGMNLVAKEYCASCVENLGVLILSEFAGAAVTLRRGALLVNPYNVEHVADQIFEAYQMTRSEQARRMSQLRREIQRNNVFRWIESFLDAARRPQLQVGRDGVRKKFPPQIEAWLENRDKRMVLALDYDGTLVPICERPEQAHPDSELLNLLRELTGCAVVVILTGRNRTDMARWIPDPGVTIVTSHGAEWRHQGRWKPLLVDQRDHGPLKILTARLERALGNVPGVIIEDKGATVAVHYRLVDFQSQFDLLERFTNLVRPWMEECEGFEILEGKSVREVRPQRLNKGTALRRVLEHLGRIDHAVMAMGDDQTDEDMFQSLKPGDLSVLVGPGDTSDCKNG